MSFAQNTSFVQSYGSVLYMQALQSASRLYNTVTRESGIVGKSHTFETIGATSAQQILTRHGDTPLNNTTFDKRWAYLKDFDTAELVDNMDKLKMLIDPTSAMIKRQASVLGQKIDDEIIRAAVETSVTGENATGTEAFSGRTIAVDSSAYGTITGTSGLTVSKVIEASVLLKGSEASEEPMYMVVSAKQLGNLLATTQATSTDYNTVKALVNGEIDTFCGFKFIHSERLLTNASGYRRVLFYTPSAIGLAEAQGITSRITERADKRYSTQVYSSLSMGACRVELARIGEILCSE